MAVNCVHSMMVEHGELEKRIEQLHNYVYSKASDEDNKVEFANKCIQLSAMKKYEEALRARLENKDIIYENGQYFAHLANPCIERNDDEANVEQSGITIKD